MPDTARVLLIRQMEELHTFSDLINRTRRRDIGEFTVRQARTEPIPFTATQQALHDEVLRLQERLLRLKHGDVSVKFLMSMIRRQLASCVHGLAPLLEDVMQRGLDTLEVWDPDDPGAPANLIDSLRTETATLVTMSRALPPDDPKVDRLVNIAREKAAMPNRRLLIFSTFRHTLAYLETKLGASGVRVGKVHGAVDDEDRRSIRRRFALPESDPDAVDVLLSSEIGSEGLDFQFCDGMVNYDIPWNPMRIEQRIGRIDRYGQKSESVAIWNLVTPGTVDFEVYERCMLRIGVFSRSIGGCEEILGEIAREIRSVAEDMTLSPEERQARLQQLGENDLRLIHEQDELEKRQVELFGIRPSPQRGQDEAAEAIWLAPPALERLVRSYLLDGMIWFEELRRVNADLLRAAKAAKAERWLHRSAIEKYADPTHFIFELLQNADDQEAKRVQFRLFPNRVEFRHWGNPFKQEDVERITRLGDSGKPSHKIGSFGIGFKSVFAVTDKPEVYCKLDGNPFAFAIEDLIVPVELKPRRGQGDETLFVLPYAKKEGINRSERAAEQLAKSGPEVLMFLNHITELSWKDMVRNGEQCRCDRGGDGVVSLERSGEGKSSSSAYRRFHREVTLPDGKVSEAYVAFRLNADGRVISENDPAKLWVYFETEEQTGLRFRMHGPFKLTDSRANIMREEPFNDQLTDDLAALAGSALTQLRDDSR